MKELIIKYKEYLNELLIKITNIIKVYKKNILKKYIIFKEYLLNPNNKRKNLTIILALIVINLFLLIFGSNAYYQNESGIVLMHAYIGNINEQNYDYILKIYLENVNNDNTYHLANSIPEYGYTYSNYVCKHNSDLVYDSTLNVVTVEAFGKDNCSIYFDLTSDSDIKININIEDEVNSNTYKLSSYVPYYGYDFDSFTCDNNSSVTFDSNNHKISINSLEKDNCNLYFKKINNDITINLYIETDIDTNEYIRKTTIPTNKNYSLNTTRTNCKDINNNTINNQIDYTSGYINIETDYISSCEIYLDEENE